MPSSDRLERLYEAARAAHRELLSAKSEAALFQRACEISVEVGDFRFAWIGVLDADSEHIRAVAQCGSGDGYLDEIAITSDGGARSRGPTGSAVRDGRSNLCTDIATDPRMAPWREAALRRGFRASGAFPFARGGRPFGALNVYTAEVGFVDRREVRWLDTIAESIGFALDFLDRELHRAEADARLRASEERYRTIVEFASDGIFLAGADLRYVEVNPAGCAMLGYSRDEIVGKSLLELIEPANLAGYPLEVAELPVGIPVFAERRLVRKDGKVIDVEIHGVKLRDGRLQSVTRDVTERKRIEAERQANDRMTSLGRLAQGIGHEINNPLVYVTLNLELAQRNLAGSESSPADRAEAVAALAAASDGAARIAHTVRALSAFGRGDSESKGPTELSRVIQSAVTLTNNRLKHVCDVEQELTPGLLVLANEFRLVQVVVNLLLNAADAMEQVQRSRHVLRVATRRIDGGRAAVEVTDTGPGIDPSMLDRIFDPFFTTKPVGRGTGIGLSISQSIISDFGGKLTAENEPSGGARFRVTLSEAGDAAKLEPEPSAEPETVDALRVLIIDDEPAVARVIQHILEGHEVDIVNTTDDALLLCAANDYDCILCDLMLPDRGGDVFYDSLAELKPALARKVVVMTGGAFAHSARAFLQRVDTPRLDKPFTARAVREMVFSVARS